MKRSDPGSALHHLPWTPFSFSTTMSATNLTINHVSLNFMLKTLRFRDRVKGATQLWLLTDPLARQAGATIAAVQSAE